MFIVFLSYFILLEYSLSSSSHIINTMLCSQIRLNPSEKEKDNGNINSLRKTMLKKLYNLCVNI